MPALLIETYKYLRAGEIKSFLGRDSEVCGVPPWRAGTRAADDVVDGRTLEDDVFGEVQLDPF